MDREQLIEGANLMFQVAKGVLAKQIAMLQDVQDDEDLEDVA